eukprot:Cvel_21533.t1-p1 / transcript=Cvel_21533.t1 / gene=Cvel_21533 / organism=Chromera_velia_CCMP2878 / gene_product=hypothetical protein / transcript_product=hypothetical protein / location=Cvel_scaffold2029:2056-2333(-) / protein_length=56 / sequence_SO=supercontig / SO=protein_coding / is_pseudo=false
MGLRWFPKIWWTPFWTSTVASFYLFDEIARWQYGVPWVDNFNHTHWPFWFEQIGRK